jgi:hypothetical protein
MQRHSIERRTGLPPRARLSVTYQAVCKIRVRFVERGMIAKTADCVPNRAAARFRWLLAMSVDEPF